MKPNKNGFYPRHCGTKPLKYDINNTLDIILFMLHMNVFETRLRNFMNDVNAYLERNESFHYGLSEGFLATGEGFIEHGVPSHELIKIIRERNPKTREELLDFMRKNYHICLVTHEEDERLRKLKLIKSMPDDWKHWSERYERAGIKIIVQPGK